MTPTDGLSGYVDRRTFLCALAATLPAGVLRPEIQESAIPIIDTHIHLFDQTRPQGAPYAGGRPPGSTAPTLPSYPPRYRALARPLGIVGAIVVEASPWVEDNLWVLQVAETDTMVVGVIGNLEPDKPEFAEYLDRYRKNPLFLGIRYGNLWGRDLTKQTENAAFLAGVKRLADAGLVFETANPRIALLEAIVRLTDKVPDVRVVLDHLPGLIPAQASRRPTSVSSRNSASVRGSSASSRMSCGGSMARCPSTSRPTATGWIDWLMYSGTTA